MKGGIGNLMKQAQRMQADMQKAQDDLAKQEVQGESGGGLVKITMTCKYGVRKVEIDESLLADDRDMLEDLIAAAFNDGAKRVEQVSQDSMSGITDGMNLPAGMKLPF